MVSSQDLISGVALFILFRETVEASIICGVLLQFLSRSRPLLKRAVWWGVLGGVAVSIIFGVIFVTVFYVASNNLFTGNSKQIFKGVLSLVAAALITYLGFKMLCFIGWETKWKRRLEGGAAERMAKLKAEEAATKGVAADAVATSNTPSSADAAIGVAPAKSLDSPNLDKLSASGSSSANIAAVDVEGALVPPPPPPPRVWWNPNTWQRPDPNAPPPDMTPPTRKEWWGIWVLVWTTVTREGIESVVFIGGVGGTIELTAIPLSAFVGITAGVLVGVFLFYTGKQVKDLKWFLITMSCIIFLMATGQVSLGIEALQNAGMFGYFSPWISDRPPKFDPVWNADDCCNIQKNEFWELMHAIFGWQSTPTKYIVGIYFGYWGLIIVIALYRWWRGNLFDADFKFKQQQLREEEKRRREAERAAALELDPNSAAALAPLADEPAHPRWQFWRRASGDAPSAPPMPITQ